VSGVGAIEHRTLLFDAIVACALVQVSLGKPLVQPMEPLP
jgi:hypothetical protein